MSALMELTATDCSATFDPADGGRLVSFQVRGQEILCTGGADLFHWGNFVMAPWVGRLRDARLDFEGKSYPFVANKGPNALHGLVTDTPWQVTGDGEMSVALPAPWPWAGRVVQRTTLSEGRAEFVIELHAEERMPAAIGWHPWFVRKLPGAPDSAELQLDIAPGKMWLNDETGLPTGALGAPVPQPWDYCFRELAADPVLRWPGVLELTVSSDCDDWIIYNMEPEGLCVEPWTAPPNSLNLPNPRIVLPGDPLVATMTWTWR